MKLTSIHLTDQYNPFLPPLDRKSRFTSFMRPIRQSRLALRFTRENYNTNSCLQRAQLDYTILYYTIHYILYYTILSRTLQTTNYKANTGRILLLSHYYCYKHWLKYTLLLILQSSTASIKYQISGPRYTLVSDIRNKTSNIRYQVSHVSAIK